MQFSSPARGGPFWPFGTRQGSRNFDPLRRCGPLTFSPVIYGGFGCFISPRGFCLMPKPENLMPSLEANFWTIVTAVWTIEDIADRQPERLLSPVIFEVLVLFRRSPTQWVHETRPRKGQKTPKLRNPTRTLRFTRDLRSVPEKTSRTNLLD